MKSPGRVTDRVIIIIVIIIIITGSDPVVFDGRFVESRTHPRVFLPVRVWSHPLLLVSVGLYDSVIPTPPPVLETESDETSLDPKGLRVHGSESLV